MSEKADFDLRNAGAHKACNENLGFQQHRWFRGGGRQNRRRLLYNGMSFDEVVMKYVGLQGKIQTISTARPKLSLLFQWSSAYILKLSDKDCSTELGNLN